MHYCIKGKYVKKIKKDVKRSAVILEIIHTDICGPFPMKSVDGYDSFKTFIDDYSRYGYIYPIKERSEALDKFKIFNAKVENQHNLKIKIVRSDRGGSFWTFCKVLTGKWHSCPILYTGCASAEWSS